MTTWIIPCNANYYDIVHAFENLKCIDWKQSRRIAVGDVVYIYVGRPIKAVMFKCRVNKVNLPAIEIDDSAFVIKGDAYENYGNYMELELLVKFSQNELHLERLSKHGLQGSVQGPRRTNDLLDKLFNEVESHFPGET